MCEFGKNCSPDNFFVESTETRDEVPLPRIVQSCVRSSFALMVRTRSGKRKNPILWRNAAFKHDSEQEVAFTEAKCFKTFLYPITAETHDKF